MAQATPRPGTKKTRKPAPVQFTVTLGATEAQALLAIVGLTRGRTLSPLYASLEAFHEEHDIERREVAEEHNIRGFDEDNLVDWWFHEDASA